MPEAEGFIYPLGDCEISLGRDVPDRQQMYWTKAMSSFFFFFKSDKKRNLRSEYFFVTDKMTLFWIQWQDRKCICLGSETPRFRWPVNNVIDKKKTENPDFKSFLRKRKSLWMQWFMRKSLSNYLKSLTHSVHANQLQTIFKSQNVNKVVENRFLWVVDV